MSVQRTMAAHLGDDRALASALIVAAVTAVAMVVSFDTIGTWALFYGVPGSFIAGGVSTILGARRWRPLILAIASGVLSYVLLLPAAFVVIVVVYALDNVWSIVQLLTG